MTFDKGTKINPLGHTFTVDGAGAIGVYVIRDDGEQGFFSYVELSSYGYRRV